MTFENICDRLKAAGIEDYRYEAMILISELCGEMSEYTEYDSTSLASAVERRCEHYPLQYILGKWWFGDCEFKVDEGCLIPRADTETVVETALRYLPCDKRFADLCAGSGCIGVLLLHMRKDLRCDAVELYPKALALAQENAELNGVSDRYAITRGDVLLGEGLCGEYAAIISNPPYIRRDVIKTLSQEVRYEPHAALDGGEDGLVFYRAILEKYIHHLAPDGVFIFEIGYDQAQDIKALAELHSLSCEIIRDLCKNDRVAVLRRV